MVNKPQQNSSEVLESCRLVAAKSRSVHINQPALEQTARRWKSDGAQPPPWDEYNHFFDGTEKTVAYLLVLDTLNFCFWPLPGQEKWTIEYNGSMISGYHALAAALKKALQSGIPLQSAAFLADITLEDLRHILEGARGLQLLDERRRNLHELGRVLLESYAGKAHCLVEKAGGSALSLSRTLAAELNSFRDIADYHGSRVYFYKRAQILAADLHGAFKGRKWGYFRDIDRLTAFADYKLPQLLRQMGILVYDMELARRVDQMVLLPPGSAEEVEIRANTVWAVELIRRSLQKRRIHLRSVEIDWILWNRAQADEFRRRPYHRTVSVFY
jgi:hypothetical protein